LKEPFSADLTVITGGGGRGPRAHTRSKRVWTRSEDLCKWACRERQFVAEKDNYTGPGSGETAAPGG